MESGYMRRETGQMSPGRKKAMDRVLYNFRLYKRGIVSDWECMEEIALVFSALAPRDAMGILPENLMDRFARWALVWLRKYREGRLPFSRDASLGREKTLARTLSKVVWEFQAVRAGGK